MIQEKMSPVDSAYRLRELKSFMDSRCYDQENLWVDPDGMSKARAAWIDPDLTFQRDLSREARYASLNVYLVLDEHGCQRVLKIASPTKSCLHNKDWINDNLRRERKLLLKANRYCIDGVPRLITEYCGQSGKLEAILKEYFPGQDLLEYGKQCENVSAAEGLRKTVRELHKLGFASLEICPKNVIISPEEDSLKLVDFGDCTTRDKPDSYGYRWWVEQDNMEVNLLLKTTPEEFQRICFEDKGVSSYTYD